MIQHPRMGVDHRTRFQYLGTFPEALPRLHARAALSERCDGKVHLLGTKAAVNEPKPCLLFHAVAFFSTGPKNKCFDTRVVSL